MLLGLWKDLRVTLPWFTGLFIVHTRFLALVHLVNLSRSVSLDKVTEAPRVFLTLQSVFFEDHIWELGYITALASVEVDIKQCWPPSAHPYIVCHRGFLIITKQQTTHMLLGRKLFAEALWLADLVWILAHSDVE